MSSTEVKDNKRKKDVCRGSSSSSSSPFTQNEMEADGPPKNDATGGAITPASKKNLLKKLEKTKKNASPRKRNKKDRTSSFDEAAEKTDEKEELIIVLHNNKGKDSSEEEEGGFLILPDELWLMIFSYLTLVEKARCGMVCHQFWKWSSDRILYRTVDFSPYPERIGAYRLISFASQPKTVDTEVLILKGCSNVTDAGKNF